MSHTFHGYYDGTVEVMRIDMRTPYAPLFPSHIFYQIDAGKSEHFPMHNLSEAEKGLGDVYAFSSRCLLENGDTGYLFQRIDISPGSSDSLARRERFGQLKTLLQGMRRAMGEPAYKDTHLGFLVKTMRAVVYKMEEECVESVPEAKTLRRVLEV